MKPSDNKVPNHIGIILDGNRRFAKKLMLKPWKGHEWGAKKLEKIFEWSKEMGIKELTLYAFSTENINRPKQELDFLMDIFRKEFKNLKKDPRVYKDKVKINFIGKLDIMPEDLQKLFSEITELTKEHDKFVINFAIAYGGRTEVLEAVKRIATQTKENKLDINKINEEVFAKNLYTKSNPDLIIRTGGEKRTSNFLIWQAAYSEWIFLDKAFPEFEKEDLIKCIEEYSNRQRRFGR